MTALFLFSIDSAFEIAGRGCVIVPGIPESDLGSVRLGDAIRLVTPDGETFETAIAGIESLNYGSKYPEKISFPILLRGPIVKDQIPPGTLVYKA
ncbi:MAG TPA: hypothetical protein VNW52_08300 [Burkholderiaceae bacterium]|jgi:hypothetical protein|nr:hypothetical protein [Burkholderiaceae bacterium]